jgi:hypothetical protein
MLLESLWRLKWAKLGCGELTAPWPTAVVDYAEEPWLVHRLDRYLVAVNGVGGVEDCPSILVGELCSGDDRHQGASL